MLVWRVGIVCVVMMTSVAHAQIVDPWAEPAASEPPPPPPPPPTPKQLPTPSPVSLKMRRDGDWLSHPAPKLRPHRVRAAEAPVLVQSEDSPSPPPRVYPYEVSARPLVLPPGVTELGLAYERISATVQAQTPYDPYGDYMETRRTSQTPDIFISHAFSRAELGVGLGQTAYLWAAIDTQAFPGRVGVTASFSGPQPDDSYGHVQGVSFLHKLVGNDSIAFTAGLSANLYEVGGVSSTGGRYNGAYVNLVPGFSFDGQVSRSFALTFGGGAFVPVAHSAEVSVEAVGAAHAGATIALDTWDIVVRGSLANPTERAVTVFLVGFRKRWGLGPSSDE